MAIKRTPTTLANEAWADGYLGEMYRLQALGVPEPQVHHRAALAAGQAHRRFIDTHIRFPVPPGSLTLSFLTFGMYGLARRAWIRVQIRDRERRLGVSFGGRPPRRPRQRR